MQGSFAAKDLQAETLGMIMQVIGPDETSELLQSLVASIQPALTEMNAARRAGDFASLARSAHRLAGGCGSLGALAMQDALRTLERAALQQSGTQCDADLARMQALYEKLRHAVAEYSSADMVAD
jgi:HPt (histidine-containing phosphotransfer) domain-containing protein